jgi:hypothetical protein
VNPCVGCDWVVVMLRGCDGVAGFLPYGLMLYDSMAVWVESVCVNAGVCVYSCMILQRNVTNPSV